jgi:hypothetical protein
VVVWKNSSSEFLSRITINHYSDCTALIAGMPQL